MQAINQAKVIKLWNSKPNLTKSFAKLSTSTLLVEICAQALKLNYFRVFDSPNHCFNIKKKKWLLWIL
jgi:hypothetical protein